MYIGFKILVYVHHAGFVCEVLKDSNALMVKVALLAKFKFQISFIMGYQTFSCTDIKCQSLEINNFGNNFLFIFCTFS